MMAASGRATTESEKKKRQKNPAMNDQEMKDVLKEAVTGDKMGTAATVKVVVAK